MNVQVATLPKRVRVSWTIALAIVSLIFGAGTTSVGQDAAPPVVLPLVHQYLFNPEMPPSITVQLMASDSITPSHELAWSNLEYSGWGKDPTYPDVSAITDPIMSPAGILQWDLAGWNDGYHFFQATVTNSRNRSEFGALALTVQIAHIPEPTSATCVIGAGLSILGLVRPRGISRSQAGHRRP